MIIMKCNKPMHVIMSKLLFHLYIVIQQLKLK